MTRSRRAAALAVCLVLSALTLAPDGATAAPAQEPEAAGTLTVTPTTGLVDGEVLTVSGRGVANGGPGIVEVAQCRTRRTGEFACGETEGFGLYFENGAFDLTVPAAALLDLMKGPYDCRPAAGRCELRVRLYDFTGRSLRRAFPLTFDPDAPFADPPTLTVTPSTDLVDHQTLTAEGTGFAPDSPVLVTECPANAQAVDACDANAFFRADTDGNGSFSIPVATSTLIDGGSIEADCRTTDCMFVASSTDGFDSRTTATAPVTFDPAGALDPPPSITVTPATGLLGGQTVTVHGDHFTPFQFAFVFECKPRAVTVFGCSIYNRRSPGARVEVGPSGSFDVDFQVRPRWYYLPRGTTRNCRLERCAIGALSFTPFTFDAALAPTAVVPITFAPHAP